MQRVYGVGVNIPKLEDIPPAPIDISKLSRTAQRFGRLATAYDVLGETYHTGLVERVIEGGKLGIQRGIELTEDEAKLAVKDYQLKIAAQAQQQIQQAQVQTQVAQQQVQQHAQAIDYTVEQTNRIAFKNPANPNEILHVKSLQDMLVELERITNTQIPNVVKKAKVFQAPHYGDWENLTLGNLKVEAVEKWGASNAHFKDRNRYLNSIGVPIPAKTHVKTPVKAPKPQIQTSPRPPSPPPQLQLPTTPTTPTTPLGVIQLKKQKGGGKKQ